MPRRSSRSRQTTPKYPVRMNGTDPFNPQRGVQTWTEMKTPKQIYAMKRAANNDRDRREGKALLDRRKNQLADEKKAREKQLADDRNADRNMQQNDANAAKHQRDLQRGHEAEQKKHQNIQNVHMAEEAAIANHTEKLRKYNAKQKGPQQQFPPQSAPSPRQQSDEQSMGFPAGLPQRPGASATGMITPPQVDRTYSKSRTDSSYQYGRDDQEPTTWDGESPNINDGSSFREGMSSSQPGSAQIVGPYSEWDGESEQPGDEVEIGGPMARAPQPILAGRPMPSRGAPMGTSTGAIAPPTPRRGTITGYGADSYAVAREVWKGEAIGSDTQTNIPGRNFDPSQGYQGPRFPGARPEQEEPRAGV